MNDIYFSYVVTFLDVYQSMFGEDDLFHKIISEYRAEGFYLIPLDEEENQGAVLLSNAEMKKLLHIDEVVA